MAIDSPINAVYYYNISEQYARYPSDEKRAKIDAAVSRLSGPEVEVLLERIRNNEDLRGVLLYRLAAAHMAEDRKAEARRVISEFLENFSDHRKVDAAERLLEEYEILPLASRHTIGCLLPLSGAYQIYGNRALRGVELAMNQAGGLHLVIRDTGSDPQQGMMAIADLLDVAAPSAIIGPIITAETVAPEAQNARIPIITLTQKEGIPAIGDFVFRNFITPRMQVDALVSHALRQMGRYRFGVLYPNEKYGFTFLELFQEAAAMAGGTVVSTAAYDTDQTDFRDAIRTLRGGFGGRRSPGFDALFIPDAPRKTGLILPQLAFYDIRTQLMGTNLWHSDQLLGMAGEHAEGAVFPTGFFAESRAAHVVEFVDAFQEAYGETPGFIEAIAYDTARLLIQLLSRPDIRSKSALQEQLAHVRDFPGVTGPTSFDPSGAVRKDLYLLQVRDGKFVDTAEGGVAMTP
jgi:ABC-type branched-subunit amino acid transport system substrate-binding protein